jgi:hypothetical protein
MTQTNKEKKESKSIKSSMEEKRINKITDKNISCDKCGVVSKKKLNKLGKLDTSVRARGLEYYGKRKEMIVLRNQHEIPEDEEIYQDIEFYNLCPTCIRKLWDMLNATISRRPSPRLAVQKT